MKRTPGRKALLALHELKSNALRAVTTQRCNFCRVRSAWLWQYSARHYACEACRSALVKEVA